MRILGVHHVSINVTDVAAARAFYVEALGATERSDRPEFRFDGAWLDLGQQQLHLIEAAVPDPLGQHFALQVEDLGAAVAELRERGVEVSSPRVVGANAQAFVHDPSGNLVELQEVGGASRQS